MYSLHVGEATCMQHNARRMPQDTQDITVHMALPADLVLIY